MVEFGVDTRLNNSNNYSIGVKIRDTELSNKILQIHGSDGFLNVFQDNSNQLSNHILTQGQQLSGRADLRMRREIRACVVEQDIFLHQHVKPLLPESHQ